MSKVKKTKIVLFKITLKKVTNASLFRQQCDDDDRSSSCRSDAAIF